MVNGTRRAPRPPGIGLWHIVAAPLTWKAVFRPAEHTVRSADPVDPGRAGNDRYDATATYTDALTSAQLHTAWERANAGDVGASPLRASRRLGISDSVPVGQTRYGYLIDAGGHPVWIETIGTVGNATYNTNVQVVNLIASQVTITPPAP